MSGCKDTVLLSKMLSSYEGVCEALVKLPFIIIKGFLLHLKKDTEMTHLTAAYTVQQAIHT